MAANKGKPVNGMRPAKQDSGWAQKTGNSSGINKNRPHTTVDTIGRYEKQEGMGVFRVYTPVAVIEKAYHDGKGGKVADTSTAGPTGHIYSKTNHIKKKK